MMNKIPSSLQIIRFIAFGIIYPIVLIFLLILLDTFARGFIDHKLIHGCIKFMDKNIIYKIFEVTPITATDGFILYLVIGIVWGAIMAGCLLMFKGIKYALNVFKIFTIVMAIINLLVISFMIWRVGDFFFGWTTWSATYFIFVWLLIMSEHCMVIFMIWNKPNPK